MVTADGDFGDGGGGWWLVLNQPGLLLALGAVLLVLLVATVITIWVVVRRLRRSAVVGRGLLQLKAQGLPAGPARELAGLRLSLRSTTDYTTNSIALAERSGRPVGDLSALGGGLLALVRSLTSSCDCWSASRTRHGCGLRCQLRGNGRSRWRRRPPEFATFLGSWRRQTPVPGSTS